MSSTRPGAIGFTIREPPDLRLVYTSQSEDLCRRLSTFDPKTVALAERGAYLQLKGLPIALKELGFKKYVLDMTIAGIITSELSKHLQVQAFLNFKRKRLAMLARLLRIKRIRIARALRHFQQDNQYELEREKLQEDLKKLIASFEERTLNDLSACLDQIDFLEKEIVSIHGKKNALIHEMFESFLSLFDNDPLEGTQENQMGFLNELCERYDEIKDLHQESKKDDDRDKEIDDSLSNLTYKSMREIAKLGNFVEQAAEKQQSLRELLFVLRTKRDMWVDDIQNKSERQDLGAKIAALEKLEEEIQKLKDEKSELKSKKNEAIAKLDTVVNEIGQKWNVSPKGPLANEKDNKQFNAGKILDKAGPLLEKGAIDLKKLTSLEDECHRQIEQIKKHAEEIYHEENEFKKDLEKDLKKELGSDYHYENPYQEKIQQKLEQIQQKGKIQPSKPSFSIR